MNTIHSTESDARFHRIGLAEMKSHLGYAAFLSLFVNLLMLVGPIYMLQVYDRVLVSKSHETLFFITLLVFALFIAMAFIDYSRNALLARAGTSVEQRFSKELFSKSMRVASNSVNPEGPLADLKQIRRFIGSPAVSAMFDLPWTPLFIGLIFMMHWLLGLVALTGLILIVVMSVLSERLSRKHNIASQALDTQAQSLASSAFGSSGVSRALGMVSNLRYRWNHFNDQSIKRGLCASDVTLGMSATIKSFRLLLQSLILGVGAYLAINGSVSAGVMIAASIIVGRALAPVEIITGSWANIQLSRNAYKRLNHFYSASRDEQNEPMDLPRPKGKVEVNNIICKPAGAKAPVLKGISFKVIPGEVLGIFGASAAGKSTLIRCIIGTERILSGEVLIDGARLNQWDHEQLGAHLGYLPQDVDLFEGTVAEQISRFQSDAASAEVIAAANAAGAHQMILSLQDGYNTQVGRNGEYISAGQRQRLGLARALFRDPPIVILDEPNSNLDKEGEKALAHSIKKLSDNGAAVIIVAHRPSTLESVGTILLLSDGKAKFYGSRDQVIQAKKKKNSIKTATQKAMDASQKAATRQIKKEVVEQLGSRGAAVLALLSNAATDKTNPGGEQ